MTWILQCLSIDRAWLFKLLFSQNKANIFSQPVLKLPSVQKASLDRCICQKKINTIMPYLWLLLCCYMQTQLIHSFSHEWQLLQFFTFGTEYIHSSRIILINPSPIVFACGAICSLPFLARAAKLISYHIWRSLSVFVGQESRKKWMRALGLVMAHSLSALLPLHYTCGTRTNTV